MKGYRKLRVGEVIRAGDKIQDITTLDMVPAKGMIGRKTNGGWWYRPLPKNARKVNDK